MLNSAYLCGGEDALAEKRAVRERRIVELYKRGSLWAFQALLAAESFGGLLSRYEYLHLISRRDQALVSEVVVLRDRIAEERRQVSRVQGLVGRNRTEREQELDRFEALERRRLQSLRPTQASAERARRAAVGARSRGTAEQHPHHQPGAAPA